MESGRISSQFPAASCRSRGPMLFWRIPEDARIVPSRLACAEMMAGVIFRFLDGGVAASFFISYCRSLIAASSKQVLSAEVKDVTGIQRIASGDDFKRVMQLLQLCPSARKTANSVQAIGAYFSLLSFLRATLARLVPSMRAWTESERGHCAYFAAVAFGAPHLLQPGHARTANGRLKLCSLACCPDLLSLSLQIPLLCLLDISSACYSKNVPSSRGVEASAAQNLPVTKTCSQCGAVLLSTVRACNFL